MIWHVYMLWNDDHSKSLTSITPQLQVFFLRWELLRLILLETLKYAIHVSNDSHRAVHHLPAAAAAKLLQ